MKSRPGDRLGPPDRRRVRLEACVDSVEGVQAAHAGGADRVELCADMAEGGTTPSAGTIEIARGAASIDLYVMIRPRGGDFLYSDREFDVMKRDIAEARELGADGVVLGLLAEDGRIDRARTEKLVRAARPLGVTVHRAFDMARDPFEALEDLVALGADRVLTSGQQRTAVEGLEVIAALVARAGERIIVMPGGGITEENIGRILERSRASEVHVFPKAACESRMQFRNPRCRMGAELGRDEFTRTGTDMARVRAFAETCARAGRLGADRRVP